MKLLDPKLTTHNLIWFDNTISMLRKMDMTKFEITNPETYIYTINDIYKHNNRKYDITITHIDTSGTSIYYILNEYPRLSIIKSIVIIIDKYPDYSHAYLFSARYHYDMPINRHDIVGSVLYHYAMEYIYDMTYHNITDIYLLDPACIMSDKLLINDFNLTLAMMLLYGTTWHNYYDFIPMDPTRSYTYKHIGKYVRMMEYMHTREVPLYDIIRDKCSHMISREQLYLINSMINRHADDLLTNTLRLFIKRFDPTFTLFYEIYNCIGKHIKLPQYDMMAYHVRVMR